MTTKQVAREFDRAKLEEEVRRVLQERHEQTGMLVQGMLDTMRSREPLEGNEPQDPRRLRDLPHV